MYAKRFGRRMRLSRHNRPEIRCHFNQTQMEILEPRSVHQWNQEAEWICTRNQNYPNLRNLTRCNGPPWWETPIQQPHHRHIADIQDYHSRQVECIHDSKALWENHKMAHWKSSGNVRPLLQKHDIYVKYSSKFHTRSQIQLNHFLPSPTERPTHR